MKILIIEDEKSIRESIATYLTDERYLCEMAVDYSSALEKIEMYEYDCILLDITLPGGNGLSLLNELKNLNRLDGVLIISARNALDDRIEGLNLGADDYLTKPFHLSELSARVAAIIRRKQFEGNNEIQFNEINIDTYAKTVSINKSPLELTRREYDLILFFVTNKNRVISKNAIAEHLWGDEMDSIDNFDFLYTHIKNLRKKLTDAGCTDYIHSIYGMGYKFSN
ncbi:MAG: response regulator transcription factor [Bacteroidota bacterium]|nr:response regulator transcription factor [Bacteroidota bacterium]